MMIEARSREVSPSNELERRWPHGIVMPISAFLTLDAGDLLTYRVFEVFELLGPTHALIGEQEGVVVRSSSNADIAEGVRTGILTRSFLKRLVPWRYDLELHNCQHKAKQFPLSRGRQLLEAYFKRMVAGSDFDVRIPLGVHDMPRFARRLVGACERTLPVKIKDKVIMEQDNLVVVELPMDTIIEAIPRDSLYLQGVGIGSEKMRQPVLRVVSGEWDNGIPFVEVDLIGRSRYGWEDLVLVSYGLAPTPEMLPERMGVKDTRTSASVNSWDRVFSQLAGSLKQLPPVFSAGGLPRPRTGTFLHAHDLMAAQSGFVSPALGGEWRGGAYVVPELPERVLRIFGRKLLTTREGRPKAQDLFIRLSLPQLKELSSPIRFGEEYGERPPVETFVEGLRVLRKAARYLSLSEEPETERALAILRGETKMSEGRLPELIAREAEKKDLAYWQIEVFSEAMTGLFYAPKEFIAYGNRAGFENYFSNWYYIADVVSSLPDREGIKTDLYGRPEVAEKDRIPDGWKLIADILGQKAKHDQQLEGLNTLEVLAWLLRLGKNRA